MALLDVTSLAMFSLVQAIVFAEAGLMARAAAMVAAVISSFMFFVPSRTTRQKLEKRKVPPAGIGFVVAGKPLASRTLLVLAARVDRVRPRGPDPIKEESSASRDRSLHGWGCRVDR